MDEYKQTRTKKTEINQMLDFAKIMNFTSFLSMNVILSTDFKTLILPEV